jgi:hypothetical protein
MLNIYIAKRYTSPSMTEPRARPPDQFPPRAYAPRLARVRAGLPHVDPVPCGPSHVPIEPTRPRPRRQTSHGHDLAWLSHFSRFAQPIKHQLFFSFWSIILLHHLLKCSGIFVLLLKHFRGLSHFPVAIINSGILAIEVSHFMVLSSILL